MESKPRRLARFGVFEADFASRELRRNGRVVAVQEQPLLVLAALLERPDTDVSREELRRRLWPDQAFLEFETGINTAVAKLRQALGDSADNPRFIATRPRHGYRFIAPVRWVGADEATVPAPPAGWRVDPRWIAGGVAALAVALAAGLVITSVLRRGRAGPGKPVDVSAPADEFLTGSFAVSPDGASLAFVTAGATTTDSLLWVRSLDGPVARRLTGTEGAAMPFWSPDGRFIGFFAHDRLKAIDLSNGSVRVIAGAPRGRGGTWNKAGLILYAPDIASPIYSVRATGGPPARVTDLGESPSQRFPMFLPDGRHFLYLVLQPDRDRSEVWAGEIGDAKTVRVVAATSNAVYVDPGYLLFARGRSLFLQPIDVVSCAVRGNPVLLADRVGTYGEEGPTGLGEFSAASTGTLAVSDHAHPLLQLTWFDRHGRRDGTPGPPAEYMSFSLSGDGSRVVVSRFDTRKRSSDLAIIDLTTNVVTQVTDDPWPEGAPVWDPSGTRVAFTSLRDGRWRGFSRRVDRDDAERPFPLPVDYVYAWTPDGAHAIVGRLSPQDDVDLWQVPLSGDAPATPLVIGPGDQTNAAISPDGRWLAYASDQEGRRNIYLRNMAGGQTRRISEEGGDFVRWRQDGRELLYLNGRTLVSVPVGRRGPDDIGAGEPLFETALPPSDALGELGTGRFGVAPDGSRFLLATTAQVQPRTSIQVTRNWRPGLER